MFSSHWFGTALSTCCKALYKGFLVRTVVGEVFVNDYNIAVKLVWIWVDLKYGLSFYSSAHIL
jgi:hypothetical protein